MKKIMMIVWLLLLTGCFSFLNSGDEVDLPEPGTKYNQTSSPIGGGKNYISIVERKEADHIVESLEALKEALKEVKEHETIFIPSGVEIDLTNFKVSISESNVTLASNRGKKGSKGALLYSRTFNNKNLIEVKADSARITGLRIEGPDKKVRKSRDELPRVSGIGIKGYDGLEVDNCEIFGWSFGGVVLRSSKENNIHHNNIHHNRRTGLGYGIALYSYEKPTNVLIEANYFTANRHSIAGSGQLDVSYEARYNYVRRNTNSHSFDMHGDHEKPGSGSYFAGKSLSIHHNTFYVKNESIVIRGIPQEGADIYENNFINTEQDVAIRQRNYFGNLNVYNNTFKSDRNAWYVSWGGSEEWYSLKTSPSGVGMENTYIGDFNDDKKSDLLVWNRKSGYISYSDDSYYGHGPLKRISLTLPEESIQHILVGNFEEGSRDEILNIVGGKIYIGNIGLEYWRQILTLEENMKPEYLRIGDFNGDGKDDIFSFDGINWFVSYELDGDWVKVKEQKVIPDQILAGKFNNKEHDSIIMTEGNRLVQHNFVMSLQSEAVVHNTEKKGPFIAGDFDGDGLADLLGLDNNEMNIYSSQQNSWNSLRAYFDNSSKSVKVGDFNGDGISDIIINENALW